MSTNGQNGLGPKDESSDGKEYYEMALMPENKTHCFSLMQMSADLEYPKACIYLCNNWENYKQQLGDVDNRYEYYHRCAAEAGDLNIQLRLAGYYRDKKNNVEAVKYYEMAYYNILANPIDPAICNKTYLIWACEELASLYLKGSGIVSPFSKKLYFTKEAAYQGSEKFAADLAWLYLDGSRDGNYYQIEALIWALISKAYDDESEPIFLYGMLYDVDSSFNSKQIRAIEEEAARRHIIIKGSNRPLTDEVVEEFYKTFEYEKGKDVIVCLEEPNNTGIQETTEEDSIDDLSPSESIKFKHIEQIPQKGFDPTKLKIKLIADSPRDDEKDSDFSFFVFSYNNHQDKKSIALFATKAFKIYLRERKLLIKLAIQYRNPDTELRKQNIATVIKDHNLDTTILSPLNKMIKSVFPGCFKAEQSNLIDRKAGKLKIPIYFHDIWNIQKCKDYDELTRL